MSNVSIAMSMSIPLSHRSHTIHSPSAAQHQLSSPRGSTQHWSYPPHRLCTFRSSLPSFSVVQNCNYFLRISLILRPSLPLSKSYDKTPNISIPACYSKCTCSPPPAAHADWTHSKWVTTSLQRPGQQSWHVTLILDIFLCISSDSDFKDDCFSSHHFPGRWHSSLPSAPIPPSAHSQVSETVT